MWLNYNIDKLGSDLADVYMEVARQTELEEYFVTRNHETSEEEMSDGETSAVEGEDMGLRTE